MWKLKKFKLFREIADSIESLEMFWYKNFLNRWICCLRTILVVYVQLPKIDFSVLCFQNRVFYKHFDILLLKFEINSSFLRFFNRQDSVEWVLKIFVFGTLFFPLIKPKIFKNYAEKCLKWKTWMLFFQPRLWTSQLFFSWFCVTNTTMLFQRFDRDGCLYYRVIFEIFKKSKTDLIFLKSFKINVKSISSSIFLVGLILKFSKLNLFIVAGIT